MRLGVLFSGGKDSTYAAYLAFKKGYKLSCLISVFSKNQDSYMFHTPSISKVIKQASVMNIPILTVETNGEKEKELEDLKRIIEKAIEEFEIEGIVTGAVESVYQSTRIQNICNSLEIECFNPLWLKDQVELLNELIENKFEVILTSVAAFPLDKSYLGKRIDKELVLKLIELNSKFKLNIAGEGGEFESLVLNCPLFSQGLKVVSKTIKGSGNSFRMEVEVGNLLY